MKHFLCIISFNSYIHDLHYTNEKSRDNKTWVIAQDLDPGLSAKSTFLEAVP